MSNTILYILVAMVPVRAFTQNELRHWYFGSNVAIDMLADPPSFQGGSVMFSLESSVTVSDGGGNLLFYSDGITVYDAQGLIMLNGNGLIGSNDAQQGVVTCPWPEDPSRHLVFHTDDSRVLRWSVVDMTVGSGEVVAKNVHLANEVGEAMSIARHANGIDQWLVVRNAVIDQFLVFPITASGVGEVHSMAPAGMTAHDFTGMLRFDRRHQWMVATMRGAWGNNPVLGLFSFDSASGTVGSGTLVPVESPWGVEFSCDGSFFYLSHNISNPIHQFNMLAGSPADILASGVGVSPPYVAVFDMMVGPDNRIYFIWNDAWNRGAKVLGAIMHPGSAGTGCVVVDSAIVWIDPYAANSTGLPSFQQPASGPAMSCSTPTRVSAHGFSEEAPRLESTVVVDGTWVRWTSAYAGYSIDVVDAAGRQLRSFRTSGQEHWLDARGLGSGIYILRVTDA